MKKLLVIISLFVLTSCVIQNPRPENCIAENVTITEIRKGSGSSIIFYDNSSDYYYIHKGLEKGLNLDSLNVKVLNKTVTLHLAKIIGHTVSEHIVQLEVDGDTIYSEFPDYILAQNN